MGLVAAASSWDGGRWSSAATAASATATSAVHGAAPSFFGAFFAEFVSEVEGTPSAIAPGSPGGSGATAVLWTVS